MSATPESVPHTPGSALAGIRVLDLSRVLAGPYCTMMLGDLGADVVKVESPQGDDTRRWGPPYRGTESAYYLCCNRNKRGIVLDLSLESGRETARQLAMRCDILVENFRVGQMERWGLGYDRLARDKPDIVYCGISGYGRTGEFASQPGYDLVIQGTGGIMSITGDPDGSPQKVGVPITDLTSGMFALSSILAALRVRDLTGRGQRIDISLLDSHLAWLGNVASNYLLTGEVPLRYGNAHPNIVPYQAFRASDEWFLLAVGNDQQWARFCKAVERSDLLADTRFSTPSDRVNNRETLCPMLEKMFSTHPASHWLALLSEAEVPSGPVNTVDQAFSHPQAAARNVVQEIQHPTLGPLPMVASPLRLEWTPPGLFRHPPLLGEHTEEVLSEWLAA